jgi:5-methylcytosine-specific restriction endonuclease McrA
LDGQQRITTLYGIMKGRPPRFFDGNAATFTGLHFNLAEEAFEFYAPLKMKDNPAWVDVTTLMRTTDVGEILEPIEDRLPELGLKPMTCLSRLTRIQGIRDVELPIDRVSGPDKTIDVVVDIFNRVNSGGTELSQGDLALAKICAPWPEARGEMKTRLAKWQSGGCKFRLEWFLRCINTVTTGEAMFNALSRVDTPAIQDGMARAERHVDRLLHTIAARLGLDHGDVLGSPYSLPVLCRYLDLRGGELPNQRERDKLLYLYVHTFLWGRYAGSTESAINQDLRLVADADAELDPLIEQLRQTRGDLRIQPNDFLTWSVGSRFYPLLYMLTRVYHAKDLGTGLELRNAVLGHLMRLELHHVFPKAKLYKHGYTRPEVNSLANFMFLTQDTNLKVTDRDPAEYLAHYEAAFPGVLASQWIPADPALWTYENYREFLAERRRLLAAAANGFLDSLFAGTVPESLLPATAAPVSAAAVVVPSDPTDEDSILLAVADWVASQGLPDGELYYEVLDSETQQEPARLDLAWPDGLQPGYSQPVALLINEEKETEEAANQAGFRYFIDVDSFKHYVQAEVLAINLAAD